MIMKGSQCIQAHKMVIKAWASKKGFKIAVVSPDNADVFQGGTISYCIGMERSTIRVLDIYVTDNFRRKGLGTYLIYLMCKDVRHKRFHNISLDSVLEENNDFYHKLGFRFLQHGDNEMHIKTDTLFKNLA